MKNKINVSKRILALVLAITLLFGGTVSVSAAEEYIIGNFTYTVSDGKAKITSYPETASGAVEIPSKLGGYPVTAIDVHAFSGCTFITEVTVPDTVKTIGDYAFAYCTTLTNVKIPSSVTSIGKNAFAYSNNIVVECEKGSYAEKYAKDNDIPVKYFNLKNAIIIVPGITGSELYGKNVFGKTIKPWLDLLPAGVNVLFDRLSCDEYGNSKADIWAGNESTESFGTVMPGSDTGAYTNLVKELKQFNSRYKMYDDVVFFPYDWRLTNTKSSEKLNDFIEDNGYDKVTLVAHSMGGIVSSNYLAKYGYEKLDKLITLGTPYLGAPKALYTFETGLFLDGFKGNATSSIIKALAPNMPGIYELLPNKQYFSNGDYYVRLDDTNLSYSTTTSYMEIQGWYNSYVHKKAENLYDSKEMKKVYTDIVNKNIDAYVIVGAKKDNGSYYSTISLMKKDLGFWDFMTKELISYIDFLNLDNYYDIGRNYGDGTVPLISATFAGADFVRAPYYVDNIDHSALASDGKSIQLVKNILLDKGDSAEFDYGCEGKVYRDTSFITGKARTSSATMKYTIIGETSTLKVADASGAVVGEIIPSTEKDAIVTAADSSGSEYLAEDSCSEFKVSEEFKHSFYACNSSFGGKVVFLPNEKYTLSMEGLGDGVLLVLIQKLVDNEVVSTKAIFSNDVSDESIMTLTGSLTENNLALEVDSDGDSVVDKIIEPVKSDKITISQSTLSINYKSTQKLDAGDAKNIVWSSSDESVAVVDSEGNVTAVGTGTATITATIEGTDISDTCEVQVSYAWWQWIIRILLLGFIWY